MHEIESRVNRWLQSELYANTPSITAIGEIGFVIPVFNAEASIQEVLNSIVESTHLPLNIVIIIDRCTDESLVRSRSWINSHFQESKRPTHINLMISRKSLQETRADNIGFRLLKNVKIVVEVQADIFIRETRFDEKIIQIFSDNADIFAVSNRGTHPWTRIWRDQSVGTIHGWKDYLRGIRARRDPQFQAHREARGHSDIGSFDLDPQEFFSGKEFGRFGSFSEWQVKGSENYRNLWLGETVMRGPLALRSSVLRDLGYLNERSHPLAFSDHELTLRAWRIGHHRAAYCPMAYDSPLLLGATRSPKPMAEELRNLYRRAKQVIFKRQSALYSLHSESSEILPILERRSLNLDLIDM